MSTDKVCKNCKLWTEDGYCDGVEQTDKGFGWMQNPQILFQIEASADDDSNLCALLRTGPNFGCVRFAEKK